MKKYLSIQGVMSKVDHTQPITQKEYNLFYDEFMVLIEKHGFAFGGGVGHHTEEELEKIQNDET